MLYVHIPERRAALMDSTDAILKHLVFKNTFRALRSMTGHTLPDLLGTTKILLKKPGLAEGGMGSQALFSMRVSFCS